MSEEEKKAIDKIKWYFKDSKSLDIAKQTYIVLNLIEKQNKELEQYKQLYKKALSDGVIESKKRMEEDKIIDLMAKYLVKNSDLDTDICSKRTTDCYADIYEDKACEKCIIEYFTKKAREV